ncbi:Uncharacterised protein [Chlamydia abortus]|nr:Uncharacterised protein [Chlamydia abortus]
MSRGRFGQCLQLFSQLLALRLAHLLDLLMQLPHRLFQLLRILIAERFSKLPKRFLLLHSFRPVSGLLQLLLLRLGQLLRFLQRLLQLLQSLYTVSGLFKTCLQTLQRLLHPSCDFTGWIRLLPFLQLLPGLFQPGLGPGLLLAPGLDDFIHRVGQKKQGGQDDKSRPIGDQPPYLPAIGKLGAKLLDIFLPIPQGILALHGGNRRVLLLEGQSRRHPFLQAALVHNLRRFLQLRSSPQCIGNRACYRHPDPEQTPPAVPGHWSQPTRDSPQTGGTQTDQQADQRHPHNILFPQPVANGPDHIVQIRGFHGVYAPLAYYFFFRMGRK